MQRTSNIVNETRKMLRTRTFGRTVRYYDAVDSTNPYAARWAAEGAPCGAMVFAELQTAGRGRHGRRWLSDPGKNLTFSLVLRPALSAEHLGLLTLVAGVAVAEAIADYVVPLIPQIKWPNDILLTDRKCCGILVESAIVDESEKERVAILGIGLNVNQEAVPTELENSATSLALETGRFLPRAELLARLLTQLERYYQHLHSDIAMVTRSFEEKMKGIGEEVHVTLTENGDRMTGYIQGITRTGALLLLTGDRTRLFHAGEVTFRESMQSDKAIPW